MGIVTELMAHTGDGKSAFMRQCAEGAARSGCGVLWLVGEDPRDATAERQLSGDTGLGTTQIGRLELDSEQLDDIERAAEGAKSWAKRVLPVFEPMTVADVLALIDATTEVGGAPLGAVFMDYAQVFGDSDNLEADIAQLGKGLHGLARRPGRGFASMLGSQVVTEVVRNGREAWFSRRDIARIRPSIGDTEWCRRLEKLCKAIWSLVRPGRWQREFGEDVQDDHAELHVIKANFGPLGWVRLGWDGPTCRFLN